MSMMEDHNNNIRLSLQKNLFFLWSMHLLFQLKPQEAEFLAVNTNAALSTFEKVAESIGKNVQIQGIILFCKLQIYGVMMYAGSALKLQIYGVMMDAGSLEGTREGRELLEAYMRSTLSFLSALKTSQVHHNSKKVAVINYMFLLYTSRNFYW